MRQIFGISVLGIGGVCVLVAVPSLLLWILSGFQAKAWYFLMPTFLAIPLLGLGQNLTGLSPERASMVGGGIAIAIMMLSGALMDSALVGEITSQLWQFLASMSIAGQILFGLAAVAMATRHFRRDKVTS